MTCPGTLACRSESLAEALLDLADSVLKPKGLVIKATGNLTAANLARAKLAIDFSRLAKGTILQAIVENWDHQRIFKETHI